MLTDVYESMEGMIAAVDRKEDVSPGASSTRVAFAKAEKCLSDARERLASALGIHSSFVNARIVASRPLGATDGRGKEAATATADEEVLDNPKFLNRMPEPSEAWNNPCGNVLGDALACLEA
jgi:hypothetical protein